MVTDWHQSQQHTQNHYGTYNQARAREDARNKLQPFNLTVSDLDQRETTILELGSYHGISPAFEHATAIGIDPLTDLSGEHVVAVGEHIPLDTESVDVVFSWNVLDHVRYPRQVMREIHRVLKPEGELLLCVNVYAVGWFVHRHVVSRFGQHHPWYFRPSDVTRLVCSSGFGVVFRDLIDPPRDIGRWLRSRDLLAVVSVLMGLRLLVVRAVKE